MILNELPIECDFLCRFRSCFHKVENKGIYAPGKGYISYFDKPKYICKTQDENGCKLYLDSDLKEEPDWNRVIAHYKNMVNESKCTKKVSRLMYEMIEVIERMKKYINVSKNHK